MAKGDLQNLQLIYLKGAVFLLIGLVSAVLLVLENLSFRFAALLGITDLGVLPLLLFRVLCD